MRSVTCRGRNNFNATFCIFSAVVLTICVFAGKPAFAGDGKVFSGSMCQVVLGEGSIAGGTIRNDSTEGSLVVECPVVRDLVSGSIREGQVRVYQAEGSTWCILNINSYFSTGTRDQLQVANSGEGYRTLKFDAMSKLNNRPYYYQCILPPSASESSRDKSRVIGYRVTEE